MLRGFCVNNYKITRDDHVNECTYGKNHILTNGNNREITQYTILNILHKVKKWTCNGNMVPVRHSFSLFTQVSKSNRQIFIILGIEHLRQRLWSPPLGKWLWILAYIVEYWVFSFSLFLGSLSDSYSHARRTCTDVHSDWSKSCGWIVRPDGTEYG